MKLKKTFVAYSIEKGNIKPHTHPVFTGEVAHDLGHEQEVQINEALDVREFAGIGEALQAVNDYCRETPAENIKPIGDFVLLETYTVGVKNSIKRKPKTK